MDRKEQAELEKYLGQVPDRDEIGSEAKKLAYALVYLYGDPIFRLSVEGAKEFGEYCAKKIETFCKENDGYAQEVKDRTNLESFVNQALDYMKGLSKKVGLFSTQMKLSNGKATYKAKDTLNGLHGLREMVPVFTLDQKEANRIRFLLDPTSVTSTPVISGDPSPANVTKPVSVTEPTVVVDKKIRSNLGKTSAENIEQRFGDAQAITMLKQGKTHKNQRLKDLLNKSLVLPVHTPLRNGISRIQMLVKIWFRVLIQEKHYEGSFITLNVSVCRGTS